MKDIFLGTARYYTEYRPQYSQDVFRLLVKETKPRNDEDRAADLGCGTGELTIPLSGCFRTVYGIDISGEMLEEATRKAGRLNISNIEWLEQRAEDWNAQDSSLKLVTIGSAFHWMDRSLILDKSLKALKTGGVFALVGGRSIWNAQEEWEKKAKEIIQKYLGSERKAGSSKTFTNPKEDFKELIGSRFGEVKVQVFPRMVKFDMDTLIGYLYSTSFSAKHLYSDKVREFETELIKELLKLNPNGEFTASMPIEVIWSAKS